MRRTLGSMTVAGCFILGLASEALHVKVIAAEVLRGAGGSRGGDISGTYLEARTCQVYTGPCFANGEVGLTGNDALMAWNIDQGEFDGTDLSGLGVVVVVHASDTLGFYGLDDAREIKAMVYVDALASPLQHAALVDFARAHAGRAGEFVVDVRAVDIVMQVDVSHLVGKLTAGDRVQLEARQARPSDCICSNESAYYPPLVKLAGFVPGVVSVGEVSARALGARWSIPDSRSAYLGRFAYRSDPQSTASVVRLP